jgi:hypothetical protein
VRILAAADALDKLRQSQGVTSELRRRVAATLVDVRVLATDVLRSGHENARRAGPMWWRYREAGDQG